MRKLLILFCLTSIIFIHESTAQLKGLGWDLNGGASIPVDQLRQETALIQNGLQLNTGLSYLGKRFGLALNTGYFNNPLDPKAISQLKDLPAASGLQFNRTDWTSIYGAIGPVLGIGEKALHWNINPQLGLRRLQVPTLGTRTKAIGQENTQELALGASTPNGWQNFWSVSTQLQWQLSRRLGIQLNAGYLSAFHTQTTSPEQIATQLERMGVRKGIRSVQDLALRVARQQTDVLHLGAGITYHLSTGKDQQEKAERSCENSVLISPAKGAIFLLEGAQRPGFSWTNPTSKEVKYYHFQLFAGGQQLFEQTTEKNEMPHQDALEAIYEKGAAEEQQYSWQVTTFFGNCEPLVSERFYFTMSNRSGVFHDIFDLACDAPAYNDQGDLRLTGKISFFNNISASDPLIINSFSDVIIQDAFGNPLPGVVLTNITDCISSLPIPLPLSIAPGSTETYCFKLVVPAGHAAIRSEAHGTINGLPQLSTDQDELPTCSCTVCDDWRFNGKASSLKYVNSGGNVFNAMLMQDFQISNAAPIKEVKAEIVYVEHVANDPQCYTCTKHHNEMGLMSFHSIKPMVVQTNGNWKNNKLGYKGPGDAYDSNNDHYVNQVIWKASDPMNGIDFSNYSHRFRIPINLPRPSSLDCCDHRYEVCVRYTFTDINCVSCDYLVCYRMSPKQSSGGVDTGGLDPGTGVDLGGIGISPSLPLPVEKQEKKN